MACGPRDPLVRFEPARRPPAGKPGGLFVATCVSLSLKLLRASVIWPPMPRPKPKRLTGTPISAPKLARVVLISPSVPAS